MTRREQNELLKAQILESPMHIATDPVLFAQQLKKILKANPTLTKESLAEKLGFTLEKLERIMNHDSSSEVQDRRE